jgi:hypothetical protein
MAEARAGLMPSLFHETRGRQRAGNDAADVDTAAPRTREFAIGDCQRRERRGNVWRPRGRRGGHGYFLRRLF